MLSPLWILMDVMHVQFIIHQPTPFSEPTMLAPCFLTQHPLHFFNVLVHIVDWYFGKYLHHDDVVMK